MYRNLASARFLYLLLHAECLGNRAVPAALAASQPASFDLYLIKNGYTSETIPHVHTTHLWWQLLSWRNGENLISVMLLVRRMQWWLLGPRNARFDGLWCSHIADRSVEDTSN